MKKSKLLIPLAGVAALGATVAPIATLASCKCAGSTTKDVSTDDTAYLTELNKLMAKKDGLVAPHKAVQVLKDLGYDVQAYHLSNSKCQFAFDASAKRFIIMKGDKVVACPKGYKITNNQSIFKFTKTYDKTSKFGQYLMDNYEMPENEDTLEVTTSLDVGNNTNIEKINYTATSSTSKYVLLRTHCEQLSIDAKNDEVFHMGDANNVNIIGSETLSLPNFYEVGKVAYLQTNLVTLNLVVLDNVDGAQVDVLEPTGTVKGKQFVEESLTMYTDDLAGTEQPAKATKVDPILVDTAAKLDGSTSGFYRLDSATVTLASTLTIADGVKFILDLNGHKLASSIAAKSDLIKVAAGGTLTIIDSSNDRTGSIEVTENYINVVGDLETAKTATLYIEGGNFNFTGTANNRSGFIKVGQTKPASATSSIPYSRLFMYGGKINTELAEGVESNHSNQANGMYIGYNTYVQINYGTITSTEVCIRGSGTYNEPDCFIDINGGTFTQTSDKYGECIFQPQGGTLNITGGTFTGRGCIASKNSNIHINGGYFYATGKKQDLTPTKTGVQDHDIDGSVLCIELPAAQYGTNPSVTVSNATLYSKESYILQVYGEARTGGHHLAEADFISGVYYYGADASITGETKLYSGVRIAKDVEGDIRINQYGGSWIKVEE